ncbi:hypothetical protein [Clostridium estertheticum]|uniref:Uncharacterized protein n=1 Tax=Clostridium estertheticum subsp. estertheticum TaxID=1552 RepID=A0A1J0GE62_9CLOT|nr:hypothetical protein [Clostridium estertheticum]APC39650.1 hypothetical protein A7L45_06000 [Clostridium estertheticum subsp. estertheticum]MBZ9614314.1 hypothetical protein [Clostridium estertheticum subsp. laramiense]WAG74251.1 hypothetical protein LL032_01990 [Clostridium estertheticum]
MIYKLLAYPLEHSMQLLSNKKIYTIDEQTFLSKNIDNILIPWNTAFDKVYYEYSQINSNSKESNEFRSLRKAYRNKFVGGGFGFEGAIKGITMASMLNTGTGVLFLLPYIIAVVHFFFAISSLKCAFGIEITVPTLQIIGIMLIVQIIYFLIIRKNYLFEIRKSLL